MSKLFSAITHFPPPLGEDFQKSWQDFESRHHGTSQSILPVLLETLPSVWISSRFVTQQCLKNPQWLADEQWIAVMIHAQPPESMDRRIRADFVGITDLQALNRQLRLSRYREMVRILWRDLAHWADLPETLVDLSQLAETLLDQTVEFHYHQLCQEYGSPAPYQGRAQQLVVLGLGKLGGRELNVSSDIDIICVYPQEGETNGEKSISHEEFFSRLTRQVVSSLSQITADGFAYRVDLRLRPFGESGPIVASFAALECYYQTQGRTWERYALIKARCVAGDQQAGLELLEMLKPFVYRRYLDYHAFQSLREMKAMIAQEVDRKGLIDNIKLGVGGIREIEFIAQTFQLIRGGRESHLQGQSLLAIFVQLRQAGHLPDFVVDTLLQSYYFLRSLENRIQGYADAQSHQLPQNEAARLRLAFSMGHSSWESLAKEIVRYQRQVHEQFERIFNAPQHDYDSTENQQCLALWHGHMETVQAHDFLASYHFSQVEEIRAFLATIRQGLRYRSLTTHSQNLWDRLMPLLMAATGHTSSPDLSFKRTLQIIERIAGRSTYLAFLLEHPIALSQLARLCGTSAWIANYLASHPILMDELLDSRVLYMPRCREQIAEELQVMLGDSPWDLEIFLEKLRQFKHAQVFRIACADLMGGVDSEAVSRVLTDIAESVLTPILQFAFSELVEHYGRPMYQQDGQIKEAGFAIIAYGKLGGVDLGYQSDLDLVFLHDSQGENELTGGKKCIDNSLFFARLGQKIIHCLTALTPSGMLYEVDTRLRPSGQSGLLVSSLASFSQYQKEKAWTWEHQSLVRARWIAGDFRIGQQFQSLRQEILTQSQSLPDLKEAVCSMRLKMRENKMKKDDIIFDLKQGAGGLVDIEFLVQYGVLAYAHEYPILAGETNTSKILSCLSQFGLLSESDGQGLIGAYQTYRQTINRLALQNEPACVSKNELFEERQMVQKVWQTWLG